jgi:hypothetical protein
MEGVMPGVVELQMIEQTSPRAAVGFFEEHSGNKSAMRLMSMLALLSAIAFGTINLLAAIGCSAATAAAPMRSRSLSAF